jgi:hypothetical protein
MSWQRYCERARVYLEYGVGLDCHSGEYKNGVKGAGAWGGSEDYLCVYVCTLSWSTWSLGAIPKFQKLRA